MSQSNAAGSRGDLADQLAVVEIVEKELSGAKANLNQLIQERDNKLRMVQIGEYTTARYTSHKNILKKVVYGIVVVILITMLMSFDWFPKMVGTVGIFIVIAITLAFIASDLLDNFNRSNLVWSQFTQSELILLCLQINLLKEIKEVYGKLIKNHLVNFMRVPKLKLQQV